MLKLTKKADYGLIALKHLANHKDDSASSAKEISDSYGIPLPILAKVLQTLMRGGFLRSEHGVNGGYKLARDPREITTLEVIRAIDGPVILTSCFNDDGRECDQSDRCTVRDPLRKVHEGILRLLAGMSIADMSQEDKPSESRHSPLTLDPVAGLPVFPNV